MVDTEMRNLDVGWIPVSRLPEEHGFYMVLCDHSFPKNYRAVVTTFYPNNGNFSETSIRRMSLRMPHTGCPCHKLIFEFTKDAQ